MSKIKYKECNTDIVDAKLEERLIKAATIRTVKYLNFVFEGGNKKVEKMKEELKLKEEELKEKKRFEKLQKRNEKKQRQKELAHRKRNFDKN